jgi:hypothetical protein
LARILVTVSDELGKSSEFPVHGLFQVQTLDTPRHVRAELTEFYQYQFTCINHLYSGGKIIVLIQKLFFSGATP